MSCRRCVIGGRWDSDGRGGREERGTESGLSRGGAGRAKTGSKQANDPVCPARPRPEPRARRRTTNVSKVSPASGSTAVSKLGKQL